MFSVSGFYYFLSHFNFTEKLKLLIFRVFRFRFRREIPDSGLEIRVQTSSGYFEGNCGWTWIQSGSRWASTQLVWLCCYGELYLPTYLLYYSMYQFQFGCRVLKSSFSEKATEIWKNLPLVLTLLSKNNWFVKTGGNSFQILWPSHNIWTLNPSRIDPLLWICWAAQLTT